MALTKQPEDKKIDKPENKRKPNKKLLIGIISFVLVLIVVFVLLVLPHFKGNTNDKNNTSTPSSDQTSSNQEQIKSQKELAIDAANKYRDDNKDTILSINDLYDHLSGLGYSDEICEEVCYTEKIVGFYDGSTDYDYEKIAKFHSWGYSREAIIKFYDGFVSEAEIEYLVDQCLAGRKLTYQFVDGQFQLVEHE